MEQLIKWRKWDDEKPELNTEILLYREDGQFYMAEYFMFTNGKFALHFKEDSIYPLEELEFKYPLWVYTSELVPDFRTKYTSVKEFFENPIKGWIDLQEHSRQVVDLHMAIADTAIEFGQWILDNYEQNVIKTKIDIQNYFKHFQNQKDATTRSIKQD